MMDDARGRIHLNPGMVFRSLLAVVAVLGVLGVLAVAARYTDVFSGPFPGDQILQQQFFLDQENNIPTWFSSALLLVAAGLAFFLGRFEPDSARPHRLRWYGLGVVLMIMSLDEMASLHETFTSMIRTALGLGGMLYFAWVVPGMLFVVAFGVSYLRFLFTLPRQVRVLLIAAAVVYLSGAVGMELVGGIYADGGNQDTLGYGLVTTLEELLEMVGLSVLTYTLLVHIEGSGPISIVMGRTALPAG